MLASKKKMNVNIETICYFYINELNVENFVDVTTLILDFDHWLSSPRNPALNIE